MFSEIFKHHKSVDTSKHRPDNFITQMIKKSKEAKERVDNGKGWEKRVSCPCCGERNFENELIKFEIEMIKCVNCGLRYHTKVPIDVNDYYNEPSYTEKSPGYWVEGEYEYRKSRFGRERVELLKELCGELKSKKLLDVGCGGGWFLDAALENGLNCYGLEIADEIRDNVKEKLGIEVFDKMLDRYDPGFNFDIITSLDVIEHLKDPMQHLYEINRLLNKEGTVLIYTPNYDSFSIQILKERSNNVGPGGHLQLFTKKSMLTALEKTGFEMTYYATKGLDVNDIMSMVKEDVGGGKEYCFNEWGNEIQAIIDEAECGSYMRIAAKKIK